MAKNLNQKTADSQTLKMGALSRMSGSGRPVTPLSDDQRELSKLDLKGLSEWMAEWLLLAGTSSSNRPHIPFMGVGETRDNAPCPLPFAFLALLERIRRDLEFTAACS